MTADLGHTRRYDTLCKVLDSLSQEAPTSLTTYHPPPGDMVKRIQARSRALLHLFLKARFGLVDFGEREELVTDGPQDGGIDAYYIDERNKKIYVLQSKFRATAGNFTSNNMSVDDLLKMDVQRIFKGERRSEAGNNYNDRIIKGFQKSIQKLPDAASYTIQVVLLGNTRRLSSGEIKKLIEGYQVDQFAHERIYLELLFPIINGTYFTNPDLIIEINLSNVRGDSHLDYDVKANSVTSNIKLLFVPTREIGRIMHTYKNSILKFNPRSFLELKNNPVNKEIAASVENQTGNEFSLFNNGITIISDQTSISSNTAKRGTAQVVLRNPQLVNGGQTAYTLSRIYENAATKNDYTVFKGKEVLLRIVTFIGSAKSHEQSDRLKLIGDISRASNLQTKIEDSDRRSNDEFQIKLQRVFFEKYGLYYERKRGEFSDGQRYIDADLLINREKLVRVSLACEFRANQARTSVKKFFKESDLPVILDVKNVDRYAYGYEILRLLEQERKKKPTVKGDRYHTARFGQGLRYGQYAIVAASVNFGLNSQVTEVSAVETIRSQWKKFETWIASLPANAAYRQGTSFSYVNYYKGSTINVDLQKFPFAKKTL